MDMFLGISEGTPHPVQREILVVDDFNKKGFLRFWRYDLRDKEMWWEATAFKPLIEIPIISQALKEGSSILRDLNCR